MSALKPVPHRLDSYCFVLSFAIEKCEPSHFVLLLKNYFIYSGPLHFHMNFGICLSVSAKEVIEVFVQEDGTCFSKTLISISMILIYLFKK